MTEDSNVVTMDVEEALNHYLPQENTYPTEIHQAVRYSMFAGGKRLRPLLTLAAAEIFGVPRNHAMPVACAIEMIHTYSLIHDDLPAIDDDDYRRGRLANHKMFGDAMAILAGDALLTVAFETLAAEAPMFFPATTVVRLVEELSRASGMGGMIGGQVVDILSEGQLVNAEVLDYIHRHKTGKLITCCIRSGAIMGGASIDELKQLTRFAENIGLAFQIVDDILDVIGDEAVLGKKVGSDQNKHKATYPALHGLEVAKNKADLLLADAEDDIKPFGIAAASLMQLAKMLVKREK